MHGLMREGKRKPVLSLPCLRSSRHPIPGQAVQLATAGYRVHYEHRRQEETALYRLVQENVETFFAQVQIETATGLPDFVQAEFDDLLDWGVNESKSDA